MTGSNVALVEGNEFQNAIERADIPFTLYVADSYLLLVPRKIAKVHPKYPTTLAPSQRIRLQLKHKDVDQFRAEFHEEPMFSHLKVTSGLEDEKTVLVGAMIIGTTDHPWLAQWDFPELLNGNTKNRLTSNTIADETFGHLGPDLDQAADP